jgi:hypothetical protein
MYSFSRTPAPPTNPVCREGKPHKPAELIGSSFDQIAFSFRLDDGGEFRMQACARCGLVYWTAKEGVWKGRVL